MRDFGKKSYEMDISLLNYTIGDYLFYLQEANYYLNKSITELNKMKLFIGKVLKDDNGIPESGIDKERIVFNTFVLTSRVSARTSSAKLRIFFRTVVT